MIEASGICEPAPIAQTICNYTRMVPFTEDPYPRLDCIVTVVDALRLRDEFASGDELQRKDLDEEDLASLVIQQIEFCNLILLNKASEISAEERSHVRAVIRAIQPTAEIIDCDWCDVPMERLLDTGLFRFDDVAGSAAWIQGVKALLRMRLRMRMRTRNTGITTSMRMNTDIITTTIMTMRARRRSMVSGRLSITAAVRSV